MDFAFSEAVKQIYRATLEPAWWPDALASISACFDDVGALLLWAKDDGSFGTIVSKGLVAGQIEYERRNWSARDIRAQRCVERGYFFSGASFTDRHLCSEKEISTHPCYSDFLSRHNLGYVAGIAVSPDPHIGVMLCVQRNAQAKPAYSDDELSVLETIGPHVENALRLSIRLFDAELTKQGLSEALDRMGIGVFALDSRRRVVFANSTGKRISGDQVRLERDRLIIGIGAERAKINLAIDSALNVESGGEVAIPRPIVAHGANAEPPVAIYTIPLSTNSPVVQQFLTKARALVLIIEQKPNEAADPALVRDVLGLTLGEARVAALVGVGVAPKEAAQRLGIAEDTARNVLKRVFHKVGVSRQGELAALLAKLIIR